MDTQLGMLSLLQYSHLHKDPPMKEAWPQGINGAYAGSSPSRRLRSPFILRDGPHSLTAARLSMSDGRRRRLKEVAVTCSTVLLHSRSIVSVLTIL